MIETPVAVAAPRKTLDFCLYAVVALLPAVLGIAAVHAVLGKGIGDYVPVRSDEVSYWHQIASFSRVGFGNGYYTYQEHLAPALSAYGFWGPVLPMLYGSLVALLGVSPTVVVQLNVAVTVLAVFFAMVLARPDRSRTLLAGLVLATCTPMLFYVPSGMQEPIHFGFAVVIAALFHRVLRAEPHSTPALLGVIAFAALLRAPWALLLVPACLVAFRDNRRKMLWTTALAVVAAALLGALFSLWSAPYPYGNLDKMRADPDLAGKWQTFVTNLDQNYATLRQTSGSLVELVITQRMETLAVLGVSLVLLAAALRRRGLDRPLLLVAVLTLLLPLALVFGVYDMGAGTRILGPHLLLVAVLVVLSAQDRWTRLLALVLVGANLLTLTSFRHDIRTSTRADYVGASSAKVQAFHDQLAPYVRYQPGANRWCNTILLSTDTAFFYELAGIPLGIGVSVDLNHTFDGPLRSAYVLASDVQRPALPDGGAALIPLTTTTEGTLYKNPASPCPSRVSAAGGR